MNGLHNMNSIAINILRRAGQGIRVEEHTGWTVSGKSQEAFKQLIDGGFVESKQTPKGRKKWVEITLAGRELLPAIAEMDEQSRLQREQHEKQSIRANRIECAAPQMYEAIKAVAGNIKAGDPGHIDIGTAIQMCQKIIADLEAT